MTMWTASPRRHRSAKAWPKDAPQKGRPFVKKFIRIGVDLGKNYFQVHALTGEVGPAVTRKLRRSKMLEFFAQIEPCRAGMEACGPALLSQTKGLGARSFGDGSRRAADAASLHQALCQARQERRGRRGGHLAEAMSRPGMRFVPVKSASSQATLMLHKTRELLVKQKTMSVNALRGHLSEFGIIAAKGVGRAGELIELAENDPALPDAAKAAVKVLAGQIEGLDKPLDDLENEIAAAHPESEMSRLLIEVPGIGKLIASAIVASVPDPGVFKRGRDFSAWLGLVPRQNSSGGKQTLGAITKQGNRYIRKLLVLAATSLLHSVGKRKGALRDWITVLLARKPARLVTVALANKLARIVFAMMKSGEGFRSETFAKA
jgi:transposase